MGLLGYILCLLIGSSTLVYAIEIGDTFFTGNGPGETVVAIARQNRDSFEITSRTMRDNAAEFCERVRDISAPNPTWQKCIGEMVSLPRRITVNCRTGTIITDEGAYRRGSGGGPWVSVAQPNFIMQGERLFGMTCRKR